MFIYLRDPSNGLFCYAKDYSAHFFCVASFLWTTTIAFTLHRTVVRHKTDVEDLGSFFHLYVWGRFFFLLDSRIIRLALVYYVYYVLKFIIMCIFLDKRINCLFMQVLLSL